MERVHTAAADEVVCRHPGSLLLLLLLLVNGNRRCNCRCRKRRIRWLMSLLRQQRRLPKRRLVRTRNNNMQRALIVPPRLFPLFRQLPRCLPENVPPLLLADGNAACQRRRCQRPSVPASRRSCSRGRSGVGAARRASLRNREVEKVALVELLVVVAMCRRDGARDSRGWRRQGR